MPAKLPVANRFGSWKSLVAKDKVKQQADASTRRRISER
jgi:hypothetical protein